MAKLRDDSTGRKFEKEAVASALTTIGSNIRGYEHLIACGFVALVTMAMFAFVAPMLMSSSSSDDIPRNGCPLDSVRYEDTAFGAECRYVEDRISGSSWWLLRIDGEYVVLPVEERP